MRFKTNLESLMKNEKIILELIICHSRLYALFKNKFCLELEWKEGEFYTHSILNPFSKRMHSRK